MRLGVRQRQLPRFRFDSKAAASLSHSKVLRTSKFRSAPSNIEPYGTSNWDEGRENLGRTAPRARRSRPVEDIPAFLLQRASGRKLPQAAVNEIVRRYGLIGGSPLLRLTTLQAQGLAKRLGWPVYVGMRNWKPFISDAVRQIAATGSNRLWRYAWRPRIPGPASDFIGSASLKKRNGSHRI